MDNKPYSDGEQEQEPLRDVNSMATLRIQDEDIEGMTTCDILTLNIVWVYIRL